MLLLFNADASFVARNQEAMEAARRKMQEELDAKAAIFREKQKQVLKFVQRKHYDRRVLLHLN